MLPLTIKLFVVLCFTVVCLSTEAAHPCNATKPLCIRGLPGRDGKDGAPGRDGHDGLPGPPGTLTYTEQQQLKEDILKELREEIQSMLSHCNSTQCSPQCNGSSTDLPNPPTLPITSQQTSQSLALAQASVPKPRCNGSAVGNPASSCKEVHDCNRTAPSGCYWVNTTAGVMEVHCEMATSNCGSITGGWTRVAHIDMSGPQPNCPSPLRTLTNPLRMCTRQQFPAGCSSVRYSTLGLSFTHVCGRAIGYMFNSGDGIDAAARATIDNPYVDGLSITYGTPRNHLWTYAAGHNGRCLCHPSSFAIQPPSFIGQNFYCDGPLEPFRPVWFTGYPLWDGVGCLGGSTCCDPPNLPWFHRTLHTVATEDIEVRWCRDQSRNDEDIGVALLELFVY